MTPDGRTEATADVREFVPVALSNLLPLGGVVFLGWEVLQVLATYWIEMAVMLVVYAGAALFAQRPMVLDGRDLYLPGVSEETELGAKWDGDPRRVHLPGSLPPAYPRNAGMVVLSLVFGAFWVAIPTFFDYVAVSSAVSPTVLVAAFGIAASQLVEVRREFFGKRRYEEVSVHMVLEIPLRVIVFAGGLLMVLHVVGILLLLAVRGAVGASTFETVVTARVAAVCYAVVVMLAMLAVEWSRFWASREADPGGLAGWFTPEDPREA
ncbi:DUF6498-containing protein [Halorussus halobius]|uniref:DUF6498-containing protein n=1 Tax=Halorussus halobius TaxID=1710537 RepID=UPI00109225AE|nr:DUF6498-containing protein [Halorussus halobius]